MYSSQKAADGSVPSFKPHVSLLYSDVKPVSQAYVRMIEQRVEDALDLRLIIDESSANTDSDTQVEWTFDRDPTLSWGIPGTFKVVRCEGPVSEWEVLGRTDI